MEDPIPVAQPVKRLEDPIPGAQPVRRLEDPIRGAQLVRKHEELVAVVQPVMRTVMEEVSEGVKATIVSCSGEISQCAE